MRNGWHPAQTKQKQMEDNAATLAWKNQREHRKRKLQKHSHRSGNPNRFKVGLSQWRRQCALISSVSSAGQVQLQVVWSGDAVGVVGADRGLASSNPVSGAPGCVASPQVAFRDFHDIHGFWSMDA